MTINMNIPCADYSMDTCREAAWHAHDLSSKRCNVPRLSLLAIVLYANHARSLDEIRSTLLG